MNEVYFAHRFFDQEAYQAHPHFHDMNEVVLPMIADGNFLINQDLYQLQPGIVMLIAAGSIHRSTRRAGNKIESYVLYYPSSILEEFSTPKSDLFACYADYNGYALLPEGARRHFTEMFKKCLPDSSGNEDFGADIKRNMIFVELMLDMRPYLNGGKEIRKATGKQNRMVSEVLLYIAEHISSKLTLDTLSERFYISKFNLCHIFKEVTGFTVIEYINNLRVQRAMTLIRDGASMYDVRKNTGFNNQSHFIKTFTKIAGSTPGAYAKAYSDTLNIPLLSNRGDAPSAKA